MTVKLRNVRVSDSTFILRARNDKKARKNSRKQERIEFASHARWFRQALKNKERNVFLVIESRDESVGYLRINKSEANISQEVSISIIPALRGTGICAEVLRLLSRECWGSGQIIVATIWSRNKPSLKCFRRAGFQVTRINKGFLELRLFPSISQTRSTVPG